MFVSATDETVTVLLTQTIDNGGSEIINYLIRRDDGDLSTGITIDVADYDGESSTHTVTGLETGKKYRFVYVAVNNFGESVASDSVTIATTELPDSPTDIVIDWDKSTKTSLFVEW